jgi:CheY-like chemotaxis protein
LKVGGQELGMEELSSQQNAMIADLQKQVGALNRIIGDSALNTQAPEPTAEETALAHAVLWVDDHPENNALIIEQLQRNAVRIDLVKSTSEALTYLGQRRYGAILSDMGRTEKGVDVPDAGLRLLRAVRRSGQNIPVLFYTSSFAAQEYAHEATDEAATVITSSTTVLYGSLQALQLL